MKKLFSIGHLHLPLIGLKFGSLQAVQVSEELHLVQSVIAELQVVHFPSSKKKPSLHLVHSTPLQSSQPSRSEHFMHTAFVEVPLLSYVIS